jgi:hypothetical protein
MRTLNEISNFINTNATIAAYGLMNGQSVSIEDWSKASEFCTGKKILTPCDTASKTTGPLSSECLNYLWLNKGESSWIGATYSGSSGATSLSSNGKNVEYCKTSGTLSPSTSAGLAYWKTKGGVTSVKQAMNTIYTEANTNRSPTNKYMSQCYGNISKIAMDTEVLASPSGACQYPNGSDTMGMCATGPFSPKQNTKVGTVNIPKGDYMMSFTLKPLGLVRDWSNLIHVTTGGNYPGFGMRSPGIWFNPNTTQLHIRMGDSTDGNWGLDSSVPCPMNVETPVSIVASGKSVTIKVGATVYNLTQPTKRPTGTGFIVYMADPWYPAMNVIVNNFSYSVDGVAFSPQ